jgi:hypothetical protein
MPVKWTDDALRTIRGEPHETALKEGEISPGIHDMVARGNDIHPSVRRDLPEPMKLKDLPPGTYKLVVWPESGGDAAVAHDLPSWTADGKLFAVLRIPDNT